MTLMGLLGNVSAIATQWVKENSAHAVDKNCTIFMFYLLFINQ
jgi:hypothetical protein